MTLPRFFALAVGLLAVLAGLVLALAVRTSSAAVIRVGEAARVARAAQIVASVEADLGVAERAVQDFERALAEGVVDDRDPTSVRRYLTAELIALRGLTDLTLTSARLDRYASDGDAVLAAEGRQQQSVFRDNRGTIDHRIADHVAPGGPADPTMHDTFRAAAHRDARGEALWSDLAFAERDAALAPDSRRKAKIGRAHV